MLGAPDRLLFLSYRVFYALGAPMRLRFLGLGNGRTSPCHLCMSGAEEHHLNSLGWLLRVYAPVGVALRRSPRPPLALGHDEYGLEDWPLQLCDPLMYNLATSRGIAWPRRKVDVEHSRVVGLRAAVARQPKGHTLPQAIIEFREVRSELVIGDAAHLVAKPLWRLRCDVISRCEFSTSGLPMGR